MDETANSASNGGPQRVLLGVTGGIAAYKSATLVRLLKGAGIDVQVVLTEAAGRMVTAHTFQALSGRAVYQDAWDTRIANGMAHIELSRGSPLILVAPATADFMAKVAHGLADDLLSTLVAARNRARTVLALAPAMNREMWENPAQQRNIAVLAGDGIDILGPAEGDQACGETGAGRMLEPEQLAAYVMQRLHGRAGGLSAVVTAGPTEEPIDPVRVISNRSSGKMGYSIAAALVAEGVSVTLISGPTALPTPVGCRRVDVRTAADMLAAVEAHTDHCDLFFAVAAVADYTPRAPSAQKIKKSATAMQIDLVPTVDILARVAARDHPPFCVGFAAESERVLEHAREKRLRKRLPMVVANHAGSALGSDDNAVTVIEASGETPLERAPKPIIARKIVQLALERYRSREP
jgi:phosphopantothenoylcysteine decarboxylase/phosphopantothenate--cysteine ligase